MSNRSNGIQVILSTGDAWGSTGLKCL